MVTSRRRIFVDWILLTALLLSPAHAREPATINGLVGHWDANGNAHDRLGSSPGELDGATFSPGIDGQAFDLRAEGAAVRIPHSPALNLDERTGYSVSFWMKAGSQQTGSWFYTVMEKADPRGNPQGGSLETFFFGLNPKGQLIVGVHDGRPAFVLSQGSVLDDRWLHVVGVFEPGLQPARIRMYLDGQLESEKTFPGIGLLGHEQPIVIGRRDDPRRTQELTGLLDEVSLFRRPLTGDEVEQIFLHLAEP